MVFNLLIAIFLPSLSSGKCSGISNILHHSLNVSYDNVMVTGHRCMSPVYEQYTLNLNVIKGLVRVQWYGSVLMSNYISQDGVGCMKVTGVIVQSARTPECTRVCWGSDYLCVRRRQYACL